MFYGLSEIATVSSVVSHFEKNVSFIFVFMFFSIFCAFIIFQKKIMIIEKITRLINLCFLRFEVSDQLDLKCGPFIAVSKRLKSTLLTDVQTEQSVLGKMRSVSRL